MFLIKLYLVKLYHVFTGERVFRYLLSLLLLLPATLLTSVGATCDSCLDKDLLRKFLEEQYVEEVGLLRAATVVYPDNITCYVANDNVLASRALAVLGSPLALKVFEKLNNEFNGGWNGKIDVLFGKTIPNTFYASYNMFIGEVDGYRVVYEKLNYSQPIHDWYCYADLLVYYALNMLLQGYIQEAEKAFINLTRMWDGYGFRDRVYNETKVYSVYKCALFIYLYRALNAVNSEVTYRYKGIHDRCLEVICRAHDRVKGGIYTDYTVENGKITIMGDVNTETTSIVVLAIYSNYPETIISKTARTQETLNTKPYTIILLTILSILAITILKLAYKTSSTTKTQ